MHTTTNTTTQQGVKKETRKAKRGFIFIPSLCPLFHLKPWESSSSLMHSYQLKISVSKTYTAGMQKTCELLQNLQSGSFCSSTVKRRTWVKKICTMTPYNETQSTLVATFHESMFQPCSDTKKYYNNERNMANCSQVQKGREKKRQIIRTISALSNY